MLTCLLGRRADVHFSTLTLFGAQPKLPAPSSDLQTYRLTDLSTKRRKLQTYFFPLFPSSIPFFVTQLARMAGVVSTLKAIGYELLPIRPKDAQYLLKNSYSNLKILLLWGVDVLIRTPLALFNYLKSCSFFQLFCSLLFIILTAVALYFETGTLFSIATIFVFMLSNLGVRKEGELSAYSVFNANFQSLLGTTTAEQLDREIRHAVDD